MAEDDAADRRDPEVVRRATYEGIWPADRPFPLTPLEAWYLVQGWDVAPAAGIALDQVADLPGRFEGGAGWVVLWRS